MKLLIIAFVLIVFMSNAMAGAMKLEGSCSGSLDDGTPLSFNYYSNYNGCSQSIRGAISFSSGLEGLYTGKRSFTETQDIYSFNNKQQEQVRLIFANSTGNTSGKITYLDPSDGKTKHTVTVQCEIRDYEYTDC